MAKEFEKFNAEYKKLQPAIVRYTKKTTKHQLDMTNNDYMTVSAEGEEHLEDAMAQARRNGVTGNALADFMKDRQFADAHKVYKVALRQFSGRLTELKAFSAGAQDTLVKVEALLNAVTKDLKSRSGRSESKTEIEKLQADLQKQLPELKEAAAVLTKMNKLRLEWPDKENDHIARLLRQAPSVQNEMLDHHTLPQMLVDRNRKKHQNQALVAAKEIIKICDDAIKLAATDPAAAKATAKPAVDKLAALKKIRDEFVAAFDHSNKANDFKETKDYAAIKTARDNIAKAFDAGDRKLRDTVATLRKSG